MIVDKGAWPYKADPRPGKINCIRSIALEKVLKKYHEPSIYLDSDTILRGPLTKLFDILESYDLSVKFRPELKQRGVAGSPHASTFNSGIIAIRPSAEGIQFASEYNKALNEFIDSEKPIVEHRPELKINVYADQELLYLTYAKLKSEIKFMPLPEEYNDARFYPKSVIWHGKGTARNHPIYVIEKLRYNYRFLYYPLKNVNRILEFIRKIRGKFKEQKMIGIK